MSRSAREPAEPSLLSGLARSEVKSDPFPHIVLEDALPERLASDLLRSFPETSVIARGPHGSNRRHSLTAVDVARSSGVPAIWKRFLELHTSQRFLTEVLTLFRDHIRARSPELIGRLGPLERFRAGLRHVDGYDRADVLLDAQICVNTPVSGRPSSVRGAHVDDPRKLFTGIYYLRDRDDESSGGDLELYRFRERPGRFRGPEVAGRSVEVVETIGYASNVLILFLNSIDALHGVTVRSRGCMPRRFVNLLGEVEAPLFDLGLYQDRSLRRLVAAWLRPFVTS